MLFNSINSFFNCGKHIALHSRVAIDIGIRDNHKYINNICIIKYVFNS